MTEGGEVSASIPYGEIGREAKAKSKLSHGLRERIIELAANGKETREIAKICGITPQSVAMVIRYNRGVINERMGLRIDGTPVPQEERRVAEGDGDGRAPAGAAAAGGVDRGPGAGAGAGEGAPGRDEGVPGEGTGEGVSFPPHSSASLTTGACRPVLAENSTPCCFPGARTSSRGSLEEGDSAADGYTSSVSSADTFPSEGKAGVIRALSHEDWIRMRISDLALEIKSCIKAGAQIRHEIVAEYNIKVTRRAGNGEGHV